ncbi:MAG: SUMF1/EgtB/PvdO family nonheme iron enzyme [Verrucomicrobiaceae bacterium]|nr:SUMF1/EgtB/PvdO family nonheme iron enzyme [Verrucomicrobiaceae bacterium]
MHPSTTGGGKWTPPAPEELSAMLVQYDVERLVGCGGMGAVYRGRQKALDRPVAIKLLPPSVEAEDATYAERFKNEARVMARLTHPAIVAVHDFGEIDVGRALAPASAANADARRIEDNPPHRNMLYFVMEFIDGTDVHQMVQAQGRLPPEHALAIAAHVCDALKYAHEHGVVHRDIKPSNVLLNREGQVKVADFGLAKMEDASQPATNMTQPGIALGTPDYVAPEALMMGVSVDGRADLYAVGVMLYEMLTGKVPRGAFDPPSRVTGCDPRFDAIVLKAMKMERDQRYATAAELRKDLDVILTTPIAQVSGTAAVPRQSMPHKPTAKGPKKTQDQGAAQPGEENATAAAKSKAALFIGIGAAAAVLAGAFVMFGGKKPAPDGGKVQPVAAISSDTAPITPPGIPVKVRDNPVEGPAKKKKGPKAATVESSAPAAAPGKHEWTKVDFSALKSLEEGAKIRRVEDGMLHLAGAGGASFKIGGARDVAVRVICAWDENSRQLQVSVRSTGQKKTGVRINKAQVVVNYQEQPSQNTNVTTLAMPKPFANGADAVVEFAAIGPLIHVRCDGAMIGKAETPVVQGGDLGLLSIATSDIRIKSVEYMSLDGVNDPLAALGWETVEKLAAAPAPPDATKPAAPAAPSPAPAAAPAEPTPPVAAATAPPPPMPMPQKWIDFTPDALALAQTRPVDFEIADGRIRAKTNNVRISIPKPPADVALRVRFMPAADGRWLFHPELRAGTGPYLLQAQKTGLVKLNRLTGPDQSQTIASVQTPLVALDDGKEHEVLFTCDGSSFTGWLDGKFLVAAQDSVSVQPAAKIFFNEGGVVTKIEYGALGTESVAAAQAKQQQAEADRAKQAAALAAIPELKTLAEQFDKLRAERVVAPFVADVAKLNTSYSGGLDREVAKEKQAGHLDGVMLLNTERELITGGKTVPAEDDEKSSDALKNLRKIYRAEYTRLEAARAVNLKQLTDPLDKRLAQLEADLTRSDRLADATVVRTYRAGLSKMDSQTSFPANTPAAAPASSAPGGSPPAAENAATPKDGFTNSLGMKFVPVKGTSVLFCIHETRYKDYAAFAAETKANGPWKDQTISGFQITERNEDHPVQRVSWDEAHQFCDWLGKKEGRAYRLPTDREWSIAVGIGHLEHWRAGTTPATVNAVSNEYPWGNRWPPPKGAGNFSDESRKAKAPENDAKFVEGYDDGYPTTAPVMTFKPNKLGLYDLAGNAREWCEDWFSDQQIERVLRGGGWVHPTPKFFLCSDREHLPPDSRRESIGFRVVVEVK